MMRARNVRVALLKIVATSAVLFLTAWNASASPVSIGTQVSLLAQPDAPAIVGGVTWNGILNAANGGNTGVSGAGTAAAAGGFSVTNAANGLTGTASVSGAATAVAPSATSALSLGTSATMDLTNLVSGSYRAIAEASYGDVLDVSGLAAGSTYTFNFTFNLEGSTLAFGGGRAFVDVSVFLTDTVAGVTIPWIDRLTGDAVTTASLTYKMPSFTFPISTLSLVVAMQARVDGTTGNVFNGVTGGSMTSQANFLHTLTLTQANIIGPGGTVMAMTNTSGLTFNNSASVPGAAVPEPATLLLLGSGLVGVVRTRRSRV